MIMILFLQWYISIDLSNSTPWSRAHAGSEWRMLCVWDSLLPFWNKMGPGQLVRWVPKWRKRKEVLPVKGREKFQLAHCVLCHREGASSSRISALPLQQVEIFLNSWLFFFFGKWGAGREWVQDGGEWERAKPGNYQKGVDDFFILCLKDNRTKWKGKPSFSVHIL